MIRCSIFDRFERAFTKSLCLTTLRVVELIVEATVAWIGVTQSVRGARSVLSVEALDQTFLKL